MGPVGVGKSVQGQLLAEKISYNWFSVGHFLRENASEFAQAKLAAGILFSDQEVIDIIDSQIGETITNETILDGFPRTLFQAQWLINLHKNHKINIEAVIVLLADENVLLGRLLSRGRQDDSEEVIKERIKTYTTATQPIIDWLKNQDIYVGEIEGVGDLEEISQQIVKNIEKYAHKG